MKIFSVPYQLMFGKGYLLPLCDVHLLGSRGRVLVRTLVDSGATYSIFPRKAAEDAGINVPEAANQEIQYGSEKVMGKKMKVYVQLGDKRWNAEVIFVERLAFSYGLLGRKGIFNQFNEVTFLEKSKVPRVEFRW